MINIAQLNISVYSQTQYTIENERLWLKHGSYGGMVHCLSGRGFGVIGKTGSRIMANW
jgi:hypothetical protein